MKEKYILTGGSDVNTMGYANAIFLTKTLIAGTSHVQGIVELLGGLTEGSILSLYREPQNRYDSSAIVVGNEQGQKLGYIPRAVNEIYAKLLDHGKTLFGRVLCIEKGEYNKIEIALYMN